MKTALLYLNDKNKQFIYNITMKQSSAKILLATVFMARGTSFLFSKNLMTSMPPMSILAIRFILAFIILCLVFFKKIRECTKQTFVSGVLLGLLYTICMTFEMYGLRLIDSGVSSLIENMAILLVPLYVSILTKTLPKIKTIICALLALAGVAFLSLTQIQSNKGGLGIILMICAALTYAACILFTEKAAQKGAPLTIGIFQLGTMGFLSLLISLATKNFAMPAGQNQWILILVLAVFCSCFGFTFQPLGQKFVPAESAAVLTVINPLTASIMGILIANENLTPLKLAGYIIILATLLFYNSRLLEQKK